MTQFKNNMYYKRGSILMITLWVLAILVIFALGLGHRAAINLRLARYQRDRLKAAYLAKAGMNKAILISQLDIQDPETKDFDSLEECGVNLKGSPAKDFFSEEWQEARSSFKIGYQPAKGDFIYGFRDEEGRLNINGMGNLDHKILLAELCKLREVENYEKFPETFVAWVSDTKKEEGSIFKGEKLSVPEEALAVLEYFYAQTSPDKKELHKKAQEVYNKVSDLITVYGKAKLNINTASEDALKVLARAVAKANAKEEAVADSLIQKIIAGRQDNPFKNTQAINAFEVKDAQEKEVFDLLKDYLLPNADSLRIEVMAKVNEVSKKITAVYQRSDNKIVYWHEN